MRVISFFITVTILCLLIPIFPQGQASPKAVIYDMNVSATPAVQGKGLPIEITADIGFGGACCYTVYAHDVKAEVLFSENLTLVDGDKIQILTSPGHSSGTIAAEPGGGLTVESSKWTIKANDYGEYNITVLVTGRNEGGDQLNESEEVRITIAAGASISEPDLPKDPTINEEIIIATTVTSLSIDVVSVTLFYSLDSENWISLPMESTGGDVWVGTIPRQSSECEILYYMESLDEEGEKFTTGTYSLQVRDKTRIGNIKVLATYATLAIFIVGVTLIFLVDRRRRTYSNRKGMTILGASLRLSALRDPDELKDHQDRLKKIRKCVILLLFIVMIVLLVAAINTGQLQEVISHTTNPEGG